MKYNHVYLWSFREFDTKYAYNVMVSDAKIRPTKQLALWRNG